MPASSPLAEARPLRRRTLAALALLLFAIPLVRFAPFRWWRGSLGLAAPRELPPGAARRWAAHVERAASRLPFAARCLPQAVALSWLLRRMGIAHRVVLAVRPAGERAAADALHAWVEAGGQRVLGALPGRWIETLVLDGRGSAG